MKVKRFKKFQRNVNFFTKNFNFCPPFHLLIDGTFAKAALENRVNMREQFPKYFDASVKIYTTPCCITEMEKLGPELYGALQVLKTCPIQKCIHAESPVAAANCIKFMAQRKHKSKGDKSSTKKEERADNISFIIASQDNKLRKHLRNIPGIPLIFLHGPTPTFERASATTSTAAKVQTAKKMEVVEYQKEILTRMKEEVFGQTPEVEKKGTKKRKRAGPNPLSCKKSKKLQSKSQNQIPGSSRRFEASSSSAKKKRQRVRLPKHVKEELLRAKNNN